MVTGSAVRHGHSRYDAMAGNTRAGSGLAGVAGGFEGADAEIGNGAVATPGGSQPTPLNPDTASPLTGSKIGATAVQAFSQIGRSGLRGWLLLSATRESGCGTWGQASSSIAEQQQLPWLTSPT